MEKLSQNSELRKLLTSSSRIALVNYTRQKMDREFFKRNLAKENINLDGEKVLETLIDFANFTSEDILENEFEKLKLFKLYDNKPLSTDDVINITSVNYEIKELSLAVAVAERNMVELEKKISAFFSQGKSPLSILQFVSAYFYKLSLIKTYGPNSFEARREYPFLISSDLEKAKFHLKRWSSEQLTQVINSLTMSDLKLRKYPPLFQRSILTHHLFGILEI
jgi:DNA polymerase III delta subunit